MSLTHVLPLENPTAGSMEVYTKFFRPEFMQQYPSVLSSDTFMTTTAPLKPSAALTSSTLLPDRRRMEERKVGEAKAGASVDRDSVESLKASKYLTDAIIPSLVTVLESGLLAAYDSWSITTAFHSAGVNMRWVLPCLAFAAVASWCRYSPL